MIKVSWRLLQQDLCYINSRSRFQAAYQCSPCFCYDVCLYLFPNDTCMSIYVSKLLFPCFSMRYMSSSAYFGIWVIILNLFELCTHYPTFREILYSHLYINFHIHKFSCAWVVAGWDLLVSQQYIQKSLFSLKPR